MRVEKNNHDEYLKFIDQLYELRRTYIRSVFFNIDSENEIELEKDKFQSMLDEEIISQSEYDLMEELLNEEDDSLNTDGNEDEDAFYG
jgi:transcriptional regulator CtsR